MRPPKNRSPKTAARPQITKKAKENLKFLLELNRATQTALASIPVMCSLKCCPNKHCECEDCWACS